MTNPNPEPDRFELSLDNTLRLANIAADSRLFPMNAPQAAVQIMAGAELGIGPMAAIRGIHMVKGKPVMDYTVLGALVKQSGRYDYGVLLVYDDHGNVVGQRWSPQECVLQFVALEEDGTRRPLGLSEFTWEDAKRAGLTSKDNWRNHPKSMLMARAVSQGVRAFCPEVTMGSAYTPGELGEIEEVKWVPPAERVPDPVAGDYDPGRAQDAHEKAPAEPVAGRSAPRPGSQTPRGADEPPAASQGEPASRPKTTLEDAEGNEIQREIPQDLIDEFVKLLVQVPEGSTLRERSESFLAQAKAGVVSVGLFEQACGQLQARVATLLHEKREELKTPASSESSGQTSQQPPAPTASTSGTPPQSSPGSTGADGLPDFQLELSPEVTVTVPQGPPPCPPGAWISAMRWGFQAWLQLGENARDETFYELLQACRKVHAEVAAGKVKAEDAPRALVAWGAHVKQVAS